jgi:uncharacterized protein YjbI with pentapeptide repeats
MGGGEGGRCLRVAASIVTVLIARETAMSAFEPPKYISALISAVNDGAKSAQLGALAFVAIGLFLLATSLSATDEDLLVGKSIAISQLGGVSVPIALSFGFMPAVFVATHLYTLLRFEMLAGNLSRLTSEIATEVRIEADRDRCRQLLANVEFVQALAVPGASFLYRWTVWAIIAVFPVGVLLLVQLSSLRLQHEVVNWAHHVAIGLDLGLLVWFALRLRGAEIAPVGVVGWWGRRWIARTLSIGRLARLVCVPVAVIGFDLAWCRVPDETATTVGDGRSVWPLRVWGATSEWANFVWAVGVGLETQPVDLLLCPSGLGCRYLSVPHRVLVGKVWDSTAFVELRAGKELTRERRAGFEAVVVRDRSLLFVNLSGSEIYAADFTRSRLVGASLLHARLEGVVFAEADMRDADLPGASLQGANLSVASLQGANLSGAWLQGANLDSASLQGGNLTVARLQGANLPFASLQDVNLSGAWLQGANLYRASLQGAYLSGALLRGADLRAARLWNLQVAESTKLSLVDARDSSFDPLTDSEIIELVASVPESRRASLQSALSRRPGAGHLLARAQFDAGPVLVTRRDDPAWSLQDPRNVTDRPAGIARAMGFALADAMGSSHGDPNWVISGRADLYRGCQELGDEFAISFRDRVLEHVKSGKLTLPTERMEWIKAIQPTCSLVFP